MKIYFCRWTGTGTDEYPYQISIYDHVAHESIIGACDIRHDSSQPNGYAVVWAAPSAAEHDAIVADQACIYVAPGQLPAGLPALAADIVDVGAISGLLTARGIDVSTITSSTTTVELLALAFPAAE